MLTPSAKGVWANMKAQLKMQGTEIYFRTRNQNLRQKRRKARCYNQRVQSGNFCNDARLRNGRNPPCNWPRIIHNCGKIRTWSGIRNAAFLHAGKTVSQKRLKNLLNYIIYCGRNCHTGGNCNNPSRYNVAYYSPFNRMCMEGWTHTHNWGWDNMGCT